MDRKTARRAARFAKAGPAAFPVDSDQWWDLRRCLGHVVDQKPGWKARNWIMNQEWFDLCLTMRMFGEDPGFLYGIGIGVDENAGFPRIERYLRLEQSMPVPEWERKILERRYGHGQPAKIEALLRRQRRPKVTRNTGEPAHDFKWHQREAERLLEEAAGLPAGDDAAQDWNRVGILTARASSHSTLANSLAVSLHVNAYIEDSCGECADGCPCQEKSGG